LWCEETDGEGVRDPAETGAIDAAVIGEPTALEICNAQRGCLMLRCTAPGEAAYVAHAHLGKVLSTRRRAISAGYDDGIEPHENWASRGQRSRRSPVEPPATGAGSLRILCDIRTTPNLMAS
jgi:hypothetical protein